MSVLADVRTSLVSMQPYLTAFLLSSFHSKSYPVREAAMAALEFVLDNIGCSMGTLFPQVLHSLVCTFPECVLEPTDEETKNTNAEMGRYHTYISLHMS